MFFCSQLHISRYVHPSLHVSPPLLPRNQPGRSWERGVRVGWRQEKGSCLMNNGNSRAQVGKRETRGLGCPSFRQLKVLACRDLRKGQGKGRGRRPRE